jgi:L-cystine uptake protein TcyP (sodium:dicarboxylate symporter family)|tara:strand:+ start:7332 stop:7451 length:120 start_codon:yes stop_codon:yes gene_type:complete
MNKNKSSNRLLIAILIGIVFGIALGRAETEQKRIALRGG